MILLTSTNDRLRVVTSAAVTVDVHASYVDLEGGTVTPGRANTLITTATTTDVVGSPGSAYRTLKTMTVYNRHATDPVTVEVRHYDGTNSAVMVSKVLAAGKGLRYDEGQGWSSDA